MRQTPLDSPFGHSLTPPEVAEDVRTTTSPSPELPYRGVHPHAIDPVAAERLWRLSEEMLAQARS